MSSLKMSFKRKVRITYLNAARRAEKKEWVYTYLASCRGGRELILKPQGKKYWHGFKMMNDLKYRNKTWWIHSSCQCTASNQSNWNKTKISHILTSFWFEEEWGREEKTNHNCSEIWNESFVTAISQTGVFVFAFEAELSHITKRLLQHFYLYQNPRNARNKGTGSDTNKHSGVTSLREPFKKREREKKNNFGTRKNLIYHCKDKLPPGGKEKKAAEWTARYVHHINIELEYAQIFRPIYFSCSQQSIQVSKCLKGFSDASRLEIHFWPKSSLYGFYEEGQPRSLGILIHVSYKTEAKDI